MLYYNVKVVEKLIFHVYIGQEIEASRIKVIVVSADEFTADYKGVKHYQIRQFLSGEL